MNEFDPETKALFGAARVELEPTLADRSRLDRAMASRLGVAVVATSGAANAGAVGAASAVKASTLAVVAKWIGVGAFVGLGAASGYVALRGAATVAAVAPVAKVVAARSPVAPTVLPDAPPPATTLEPQPTPPAPSSSVSSPRTATGAAVERDAAPEPVARVAAETALLRRAHEALNRGDANRALALLREHTLRFPAGILLEERSAELVQTLCRLGRTAEARSEAERFLKATPDSPLASSVKSSCAASERSLR